MELPTPLKERDPLHVVPGNLPVLWDHQYAALQRMHSFEAMVHEQGDNVNMPASSPRGILALPPGAGKSRIVLALCLSQPRVKTVIVVQPNMLQHWRDEMQQMNIDGGDLFVRLISNKQSHQIIKSNIDGHRLVYDEIESLRNATSKPATKFAHEHDKTDPRNKHAFDAKPYLIWLLDGTYTVDQHVSPSVITNWNLTAGPLAPKIIYVRNTKPRSTHQTFGLDFFPANIVLCDEAFVETSQALNLMTPVVLNVRMNSQLAHLNFLESGMVNITGQNGTTKRCLSITNVEEYCKEARKTFVEQIKQCDEVLKRVGNNNNNDEDLAAEMSAMSLIDNTELAQIVQNTSAKKRQTEHALALLDKLEAKQDKCAICWSETFASVPAITPCCYTRFCHSCIYLWVMQNDNCPMCRHTVSTTGLIIEREKVADNGAKHPFSILDKYAVNPAKVEEKRIVVYVDHVNRLEDYHEYCSQAYRHDRCAQASVDAKVMVKYSQARASEKKGFILFVTEQDALKGVDLSATDVLLVMSPIPPKKWTQLIGRVQRPGRRCDHQLEIVNVHERYSPILAI